MENDSKRYSDCDNDSDRDSDSDIVVTAKVIEIVIDRTQDLK